MCIVSGARDVLRYYYLRPGAGGRTIVNDCSRQIASLLTPLFSLGALGEVLHCYIFSGSLDVF